MEVTKCRCINSFLILNVGLTTLQDKSKEICERRYANAPLKGTDTLPGILELREYYEQNQVAEGPMRQKILEALQVGGTTAWLIHNAIKRNHERLKKGTSLDLVHGVCCYSY